MQVPEKNFGIWNFGTEHGLDNEESSWDPMVQEAEDSCHLGTTDKGQTAKEAVRDLCLALEVAHGHQEPGSASVMDPMREEAFESFDQEVFQQSFDQEPTVKG